MLQVALHHRRASAAEDLPEVLLGRLVHDQLFAERLGGCLPGQVILGGPQPAAQDQQIGPLPRLPDHGHHPLKIVAHGALAVEVDPQISERAAEERGVRVHDLAQQKFGPDGDDFGGHEAGPGLR